MNEIKVNITGNPTDEKKLKNMQELSEELIIHGSTLENLQSEVHDLQEQKQDKANGCTKEDVSELLEDYYDKTTVNEGIEKAVGIVNENLQTIEAKLAESVGDKAYSPADYSGLGRVYLTKNMQKAQFKTLLPFNGFVDGVEVQPSSPLMIPDFIYFDRVNKRFVATQLQFDAHAPKYYSSWSDSAAPEPKAGMYMNPAANTGFVYEGKTYIYSTANGLKEDTRALINLLTQDMVSKANTIYHIQYDYDLDGGAITIPDNCVLKFEGGCLKNGCITLNNTKIEANHKIFEGITFQNAFATEMSVIWFGAKSDNDRHYNGKLCVINDEAFDISKVIEEMFASNCYNIFIPAGIYYWTRTVDCPEDLKLRGNFIRGYQYPHTPRPNYESPDTINQAIYFDSRLNGSALLNMGYYDEETQFVGYKAIHMSWLNFRGIYDADNEVAILSGWIGWSEISYNTIVWAGYFVNSFSEDYKTPSWCEQNGVEFDTSRYKQRSGIWKVSRVHDNEIVVWRSVFDCNIVESYIFNNNITGENAGGNTKLKYVLDCYNWHDCHYVYFLNNFVEFFPAVYNLTNGSILYCANNSYEYCGAVFESQIQNSTYGYARHQAKSITSINEMFLGINNLPKDTQGSTYNYLAAQKEKEEIGNTGFYTIDSTNAILKTMPLNLKMIIGTLDLVDYIYQENARTLSASTEDITIIGGKEEHFHFGKLTLQNKNTRINIPALENRIYTQLPVGNLYDGRKVTADSYEYSYSASVGKWTNETLKSVVTLSGATVSRGDLHDKLVAMPKNSIKNHKVHTLHTTIGQSFLDGNKWIRIYHGWSNPSQYGFGNGWVHLTHDHLSVTTYTNGVGTEGYNNFDLLKNIELEEPLVAGTLDMTLTTKDDSTKSTLVIENGGVRREYEINFPNCNGEIFAWSNGEATIGESVFSFNCTKFSADTWLFGDSYVTAQASNTERWTSYLLAHGHSNFLLNGYSGETSAGALEDLQNLLQHGTPKHLVWCLGMNDRDSSDAVSTAWKEVFDKLVSLCNDRGIELILATIPTVKGLNNLRIHKYKNDIIKTSGLRYIDFASAVGADETTGEWYEGMLGADGVHPTADGALALYKKAVLEVPELLNDGSTGVTDYNDLTGKPDIYTKEDIDNKFTNVTETLDLKATNEDLMEIDGKVTDLQTALNDKADLRSLNDLTSIVQDKADANTTYTKEDIDVKLDGYWSVEDADKNYQSAESAKTINGFNKVVGIKNIDSARISTGWKAIVIADDSNLIWENTNTPSDLHCYIMVNRSVQFGDLGLQFNLTVNGEKPAKDVTVELYKLYQGSMVLSNGNPVKVGWQSSNLLFTDLSTGLAGSYFKDSYMPWLNDDNYDQIGILIGNTNTSDPAFTSGDSIRLTIKTNGSTSAKGYGYELDYNDLLKFTNENTLTFKTSDGSDFRIGVRNDTTGEVAHLSPSAKTSPYSLTEGDFNTLKEWMSTGMKTLVVIPVASEGAMLDTSAKLNVYNTK